MMQKIKHIRIHAEPRHEGVDYEAVAEYIRGLMPQVAVDLEPPPLESALERRRGREREELLEHMAAAFAAAKVRDLTRVNSGGEAIIAGEIDYERRRLDDSGSGVYGLLYDAHMVSDLFWSQIGYNISELSQVTVVITNQLIGTWDRNDRRYHARAIVCGSPGVLSLSGLVAAPARSRDFYLAHQAVQVMGLGKEEAQQIAGSFADDYLEYEDERMTEVVKGYVLQAVAYRMTGEPFCGDPQCRLYNAHRQEEMLAAQLGGADLCARHNELFETARGCA